MRLKLEKYHGLGNDYLVFDPERNGLELTPERVKLLCNRNLGVGADGILEGPVFKEGKICMIIWNSDGSQTENSGNGIRIFAKYLKDADYVQKKDITIYTAEKEIEIHYLNEEGTRLKASMGKASFWSDEVPVEGPRREIINETMVFGHIPYPVTCLSVGNPHLVILMDEISKDLVCRIGKYSERQRVPGKDQHPDHQGIGPYPFADRSLRKRCRLYISFRKRLLCSCCSCLQTGPY